MKPFPRTYRRAVAALALLESPTYVAIRLYWVFRFVEMGRDKLRDLVKYRLVRESRYPVTAFSAHFLFASPVVLSFGAGLFVLDTLVGIRPKAAQ